MLAELHQPVEFLLIDGGSQVYRTVSIRWTTHVPRGMSMKDIRMAEYCDWAECVVQNSLKELERLRSRDEITNEEYKVLADLSTGRGSAAELPEGSSAGVSLPEGSEAVEEVQMNGGGALTGKANESIAEKAASAQSEAFRQRIERIKRFGVPSIQVDNERTSKP